MDPLALQSGGEWCETRQGCDEAHLDTTSGTRQVVGRRDLLATPKNVFKASIPQDRALTDKHSLEVPGTLEMEQMSA